MALIKCKMCGGDLVIDEGSSIAECEYCGSRQTVPTADNEKKLTLFARANRLRAACEFDKAAGVYESIVAEFPEEAEAYWGLVLCKYGIEYVDDPGTGKKIPTCHRSSFDSVLDDPDFEQAQENADVVARRVYREEAKQIEEVRKGIIEVSGREEPYDIFICYKETAENGDRTLDSVLAQDIYDALTGKGYRVFFARITLEDKLGQEYEPYIFAALHSAKVMLAVGTDFEYYNAVWVKNEWSRFLKLMEKDKSKYLIPCFKGLDAYDMPKEFAKLQAQDLGKVGAMQDLLRGVEKILPKKTASVILGRDVVGSDRFGIQDLIRKARIHLEEKKWKNVQDTCERITAIDPEEPWAYVYQLARVMRITDPERLGESVEVLDKSSYYGKAMRYADPELTAKLQAWCRSSEENCRLAEERCEKGRRNAQKVYGLLAGGKAHMAAVMTDGTVVTLGSNGKGQCDVSRWRDIVAVACGAYYTVGLRADGTVVACGDNEHGQCDVSDWDDIVFIACDEDHTIGVRSDGTVVSCGNEANGKRDVSQWRDIQIAGCGYHNSIGLRSDGTVVAAGSDRFGQCKVNSWTDIVSISCNNVHTVGVQRNGKVLSCGDNEDKQIATKMWCDIVALSAGTHHTVGLKTDGTLITCGSDGSSRCSGTKQWHGIVGIARSFWNTLAIRNDGTVLACGDEDDGKCKVDGLKLFDSIDTLEQEQADERAKRKIRDAEDRKKILNALRYKTRAEKKVAAGQEHTVAIRLNGRVIACGSNEKGQCNVSKWKYVWQVACGEDYTVGLCAGGRVLACGNNEYGQCDVQGWRGISSVACGNWHTVGLRDDGTVVACGKNEFGQCDVQDWVGIKQIACGRHHTVGVRSDGSVLVAGSNGYGQCNVQEWRGIAEVVANNVQTVGLKKDGTVVACGNNDNGQCDVGGWKDIISVACGTHHTLGLRLDGTVVSCGYDESGRCSGARQWNEIVGIKCGFWHTLGVRADGTVVVCGEKNNGKADVSRWKLFSNIATEFEEGLMHTENQSHMPAVSRNMRNRVNYLARVAVDDDGKMIHHGDWGNNDFSECEKWEDIVAVAGDRDSVVGLRKNGTVVYAGAPCFGSKGSVECWENIMQLSVNDHIVGLRQDGTVVACGRSSEGQCETSDWRDVKTVRCGDGFTVGLRSDGTVVACGDNRFGQCNVGSWKNISALECSTHTVGLRRDGTVLACGSNINGQCNVSGWRDITQIAVSDHTVGLRADGTVVACGDNEYGQCNVGAWRDVVVVSCCWGMTLGLRDDGVVLACGMNAEKFTGVKDAKAIDDRGILLWDGSIIYLSEQRERQYWKVYKSAKSLELERKVTIPTDLTERKRIHDEILMKYHYRKRSGLCLRCGGELKGLFSKKCDACGAKKEY